MNLQVVDGSGIPTSAVNGLANLIVGYNEINSIFTINKTGSHKLTLGSGANYSSYGSIVASLNNVSSNSYTSLTGGRANHVTGQYSSVNSVDTELQQELITGELVVC